MRHASVLLDRLLGRVTMYRLVVLVLLVVVAAALVTSAVGAIPFSPLAVAVTASLAVALSYGANRVFAAVARVRPHGDSSLITGLLAFCLFWPVLDVPDLAALALAVLAANASKYLFVWRGRHVFNPVAIGAVIVTVTHVGGATWWVVTPVLLPVLVLGGALVLYRARAFDIAGVVLLITVAGTAAILVGSGSAPAAAVFTAVASYPWVFFAAFMVSEPLTLPPRRRERLLVGTVIGVVALLPLHIAWIAMAPEIALVIGNAVAFGFGPRRRVRLTLLERRTFPGGLGELVFRPEARLRFEAGQYVELSLPHRHQDSRGARRIFSVASGPDSGVVRVITRWAAHGSSFKRRLAALQPGDVVGGSAVGGDFLLPRRVGEPLLWIAGGVGITPFASFADEMAARGEQRDVVLVQVAHGEGDLVLSDVFDRARVRALVVGPAALGPSLPDGWSYAGERLDAAALGDRIPDAAGRTAYVAGSPRLVAEARAAVRDAGGRRIRTDRFVGY